MSFVSWMFSVVFKACCWSPDGTVLIFAMENDSALYGVRFREGDSGSLSAVSTSIMLADLSEVNVSTELTEQIRYESSRTVVFKLYFMTTWGDYLCTLFPDVSGR